MLKRIVFCLITLTFLQTSLFAKIVEIYHMQALENHLSDDCLIVFDIDNTIMEPTQELGTDQWFRHRIQRYIALGLDSDHALEKALAEWESVQHLTEVKLVEPKTSQIIQDLQKKNYTIMGLTTRGLSLATRTAQQLSELSVDLSKTCFTKKEISFDNTRTNLLRKGILFTAGTHKGDSFFKLMEKAQMTPKKIIFINDKATHLQEIADSAEKKNIEFVGLRYGYLDAKVKGFRPELADFQFQKFGLILTDSEAEKKLLIENLKK